MNTEQIKELLFNSYKEFRRSITSIVKDHYEEELGSEYMISCKEFGKDYATGKSFYRGKGSFSDTPQFEGEVRVKITDVKISSSPYIEFDRDTDIPCLEWYINTTFTPTTPVNGLTNIVRNVRYIYEISDVNGMDNLRPVLDYDDHYIFKKI